MVDIIDFCFEQPEIRSWIEFYDDSPEEHAIMDAEDPVEGETFQWHDHELLGEGCFPERTWLETAVAEDHTSLRRRVLGKDKGGKLPPWTEAVKSLAPSAFSGAKIDRGAPDVGARLKWIYGYAGRGCRNNVRYAAGGEVIYPACRACVVYDGNENRQRFNLDHTDDICSFAVHPNGKLAATGEVGRKPKIIVWDTGTVETCKVLRGFHSRGVTLLAFSEDGALLASIGQDDRHLLAVHNWRTGELQHTGTTDTRPVLGCCFETGGGLVTCGDHHVLFWKKEGRHMLKKKGVFGRKAVIQTLLCCAPLREKVVTGAMSGHLYVWYGRNCVRSLRGHQRGVTAMYSGQYGLVTGGQDMRVRLWSPKMEAGASFDVSAFGPCPVVHSVCLSSDGTKLLVGFKGCEIYEISAADGSDVSGGPITSAHYEGQLRGLARHPRRAEFATAGDDRTVRIWDAVTHSLLRMTRLDTPASSVDYSPDGELLVVGLGRRGSESGSQQKAKTEPGEACRPSPSTESKTGGFLVLHASDFALAHEIKDAKHAISEVRWSPDRDTVVVGCEDSKVYFYSTGDSYNLVATATKHKHTITSVDFSVDGDWLRSNCEGGHLHIWDTNKGKHQSNIAKHKDAEWSTETCCFSWATRGFFSDRDEGTRITCTDRSPNGLLIVAGDNFSRVRLFRYPCPTNSPSPAFSHRLRGHGAGGVSRARFLQNSSVLVTTGQSDRCVLQWELTGAAAGEDATAGDLKDPAEAVAEDESDGYVLDMRDGSDLERGSDFEVASNERRRMGSSRARSGQRHGEYSTGGSGADEAAEISPPLPWEQATVAPTRSPPVDRNAPPDSLELERIHGYRGRDSWNNCGYAGVDGGKAVYATAAVGVSLDLVNHTQTFQLGHTGDVVCLAISPDGTVVATGEVSRRAEIIVWQPDTGEAVQTLSGFHERAVTAVSFSPDGRQLASLGGDDDHSVAIYDWRNGLLRATAGGGRRKQLCVAWNNLGTRLVTCGLRHVSFWTLAGRNLSHCRGTIGSRGRKQTFPCCAFVGDTAVVGTRDGHLYIFEDGATKITRTVKAHTGPVYALHRARGLPPDVVGRSAVPSEERCEGLWSGGKDGSVRLFDGEMHSIKEFSVVTIASNGVPGGATGALKALAVTAAAVAGGGASAGLGAIGKRKAGAGGAGISLDPAVRSVSCSSDGKRLLVGTRGGELYEMLTLDGSDARKQRASASATGKEIGPLTAGHGRGEVWGLSCHPTERIYATCGDDGSVRVWSLDDRRMLGSVSTDCSCRALCYSPDGASIAVGCGGGKRARDASKSGSFLVFKSESLSLRHEAKDADDWIRDVNYSSDGSRLAVASNDCKIYIYATRDNFARVSLVTCHQSFVTQVDFSADAVYLQSADGARALMFADTATGVQIPSPIALRDVDWGSWTLPLGWPTKGVWGYDVNQPGMEVTCARRSGDASLLATGDNFGRVRLFKFPAPLPDSSCCEYRGHSSAVRRVCWSAGDTHLLSTGADGSVMQWRKVVEPDVIDSGDEAECSGEDSELEVDGGLPCCRQNPLETGHRVAGTADNAAGEAIGRLHHEHDREGRPPEDVESTRAGRKAEGATSDAEDAPRIHARLEAVHGCRAADTRGCVHYNHEDGVVYPAAALGVVFDPRTGHQVYHTGHQGDIISLTISKCGRFAASGDAARRPRVHVWNAVTGAGVIATGLEDVEAGIVSALPPIHRIGVGLLAFSSDGHWLASMGHDPEHTLAIYKSPSGQWADAFPVATTRAGFTRFLGLVFTGDEAFPIMAGGIKAVSFFHHSPGSRGMRRKRGVFGFRKKIQPVLCGVKMRGHETALTGTVSGHLYRWKGHRVERSTAGHAGPVYACDRAGVRAYATAGKDGFVMLWDEELQKLKQR